MFCVSKNSLVFGCILQLFKLGLELYGAHAVFLLSCCVVWVDLFLHSAADGHLSGFQAFPLRHVPNAPLKVLEHSNTNRGLLGYSLCTLSLAR